MDITGFHYNDTLTISDFYYPNGELVKDAETGDPVTITVFGPKTKQFQEFKTRYEERIRRGVSISDETAAQEMASLISDWYGIYEAGEPLECSTKTAARVLLKADFLVDRISKEVRMSGNFFELSKSS